MKEDILEEALRITGGDRQDDYGDPSIEFRKVANMWSEIIGAPVEMKHVPLCMIALKIVRECNSGKRDNWTDMAGYARVGYIAEQEEQVCQIVQKVRDMREASGLSVEEYYQMMSTIPAGFTFYGEGPLEHTLVKDQITEDIAIWDDTKWIIGGFGDRPAFYAIYKESELAKLNGIK